MSAPEECHPAYPPRFTYPTVRAFVIAGLKDKPASSDALLAGTPVSPGDLSIRQIIDRHVTDRQHRRQLQMWAFCQEDSPPARGRPRLTFQEDSFRRLCDENGWNRTTALRNVEKALTMVLMVMNLPGEG